MTEPFMMQHIYYLSRNFSRDILIEDEFYRSRLVFFYDDFFICDGELYFQVQHFNKIKKFIQKLLYNGIATNKKNRS